MTLDYKKLTLPQHVKNFHIWLNDEICVFLVITREKEKQMPMLLLSAR